MKGAEGKLYIYVLPEDQRSEKGEGEIVQKRYVVGTECTALL